MKILLTADVHLTTDHPERQRALEEVVARCRDADADYLLIAGDLFDAEVDVEDVKAGIRDLFSDNEFQTVAIPGNHDHHAYRAEDYFGDDIEILTDRPFERRDLGPVNLVAVPYVDRGFDDLVGELSGARAPEKQNVLLLHGTLSSSTGQVFGTESRYFPFTPEDLLATGYEYVFAGHVHSSPTKQTFGNGACVFACPGSPVSITTSETGRRGVWSFDTEAGEFSQLALDTFHYVRAAVDVSPGEGPEVLAALEDELSDRDLSQATLLVEPSGFIEMDEEAFFREVDHIGAGAGAADYVIDRSNVESAKTILETSLYRQFEETLEERDDVDEAAVRRVALKGLSAAERG